VPKNKQSKKLVDIWEDSSDIDSMYTSTGKLMKKYIPLELHIKVALFIETLVFIVDRGETSIIDDSLPVYMDKIDRYNEIRKGKMSIMGI